MYNLHILDETFCGTRMKMDITGYLSLFNKSVKFKRKKAGSNRLE